MTFCVNLLPQRQNEWEVHSEHSKATTHVHKHSQFKSLNVIVALHGIELKKTHKNMRRSALLELFVTDVLVIKLWHAVTLFFFISGEVKDQVSSQKKGISMVLLWAVKMAAFGEPFKPSGCCELTAFLLSAARKVDPRARGRTTPATGE